MTMNAAKVKMTAKSKAAMVKVWTVLMTAAWLMAGHATAFSIEAASSEAKISTQTQPKPIAIERLEPSNWWVGFSNPELELLLYGENLHGTTVEVDYPGVRVTELHEPENPNYLFVTLTMAEDTEPGTMELRFTQGDAEVVMPYELLERNSDGLRHEGTDASDVIYLLMPDRFANGDPSNDVVEGMLEATDRSKPGGRHGGDLQGLMDRLDYIQDLGMTAVWFTPTFENDMPPEYGAYHGYAATDMYKVDRRFGSNELYRDLVKTAQDRGMKVIMDMIHNHVGTHHWLAMDPPGNGWIHDLDEVGTTNFRTSTVSDPYKSELDRNSTVKGWFVVDMPDLDQRNERLATYLIQNTLWWVEYAGINGIRMDTYPYPYKEYMADWSREVMAEFPELTIVAETWVPNTPSLAYWQKGFDSPDGYKSPVRSLTDFPLYEAVKRGLNEEESWETGISRLYFTLSQDFLFDSPEELVIFPGNHDLNRIFTEMGESYGKFRIAMSFFLTTRGIPQLYYGDEILMTGGGYDGFKRHDFPGGWEEDPVDAFTVEGRAELADQTGHPVVEAHDFVTRLANWRQRSDAIHRGELTHFIPENNVYVYVRYTDEARVLVMLNGRDEANSVDMARFREVTDGFVRGVDVTTGREVVLSGEVVLEPFDALVLELQ